MENARWAFRSGYAGNWHPVTWLSHMLDCQMFGLNPWGHHLTNVLLHALNAGLVFALLRQMTGATWRSLLVAALFAVHPLRVESVAWVTERKDVLSGLLRPARADGLRPLRAKKQKQTAECRQRGGRKSVHGPLVSSSCLPSSIFYLLSLLRPRLDEQADAGDVAVRDVAAGLLAAGENAECRMPEHATRITQPFHVPPLREKLPFFVLAAVASVVTFVVQSTEALWPRGRTCLWARASGTR